MAKVSSTVGPCFLSSSLPPEGLNAIRTAPKWSPQPLLHHPTHQGWALPVTSQGTHATGMATGHPHTPGSTTERAKGLWGGPVLPRSSSSAPNGGPDTWPQTFQQQTHCKLDAGASRGASPSLPRTRSQLVMALLRQPCQITYPRYTTQLKADDHKQNLTTSGVTQGAPSPLKDEVPGHIESTTRNTRPLAGFQVFKA